MKTKRIKRVLAIDVGCPKSRDHGFSLMLNPAVKALLSVAGARGKPRASYLQR